jgi:transcriptional regulator with XRE-family HTH domain
MATGTEIRQKRTGAGIAGSLLCTKAGIARSRLSDIERGYVAASEEEMLRIDAALDELIRAKRKIAALATAEGWPTAL